MLKGFIIPWQDWKSLDAKATAHIVSGEYRIYYFPCSCHAGFRSIYTDLDSTSNKIEGDSIGLYTVFKSRATSSSDKWTFCFYTRRFGWDELQRFRNTALVKNNSKTRLYIVD